jgi:hypothetical protein
MKKLRSIIIMLIVFVLFLELIIFILGQIVPPTDKEQVTTLNPFYSYNKAILGC